MAVGCVAGRITSAILVWIAAGTAVGPRTSALVRACSYPRSLVKRGLVGRVRSQGLLAAANEKQALMGIVRSLREELDCAKRLLDMSDLSDIPLGPVQVDQVLAL